MKYKSQDPRPAVAGWAPGEYMCKCKTCDCGFIGAKRALTCADCAYDQKEKAELEKAEPCPPPKCIEQGKEEPRFLYLMRVAAAHIREYAEAQITYYDGTDCDGGCLADEILAEVEDINRCTEESVPPPDSRFDFRPHGWHWWYGPSGGINFTTNLPDCARWHVVHCWIAEGSNIPFAHSAHFRGPKQQKLMGGTWGPEIVPPKKA